MSTGFFRWFVLLAATTSLAQAQEAETGTGPVKTVAGMVEFVRQDGGFQTQLDGNTFDHVSGNRIAHFDETPGSRMIVESFDGNAQPSLTLYDFSRRPPSVVHIGRRMKLDGVFWQDDEVVLKSTQGWFRFERGTLTKLVSSKTIYH
jgi:hypothetical protein